MLENTLTIQLKISVTQLVQSEENLNRVEKVREYSDLMLKENSLNSQIYEYFKHTKEICRIKH